MIAWLMRKVLGTVETQFPNAIHKDDRDLLDVLYINQDMMRETINIMPDQIRKILHTKQSFFGKYGDIYFLDTLERFNYNPQVLLYWLCNRPNHNLDEDVLAIEIEMINNKIKAIVGVPKHLL